MTGKEEGTRFFHYSGVEDDGAVIRVGGRKEAGGRVSERLFGLFTEHLGRNVYGGAWAQILENGGFERMERGSQEGPDLKKATDRRLESWAKEFAMPKLAGARDRGVAPFWAPVGDDRVGYALEEGFNGSCQLLEVPEGSVAGVETPVYLPLHRVGRLNLTLQCMLEEGAVESIRFQVLKVSGPPGDFRPLAFGCSAPDGGSSGPDLLAEEELRLHPAHRSGWWTTLRAGLNVYGTHEPGGRYILRILVRGSVTIRFDQAELFPGDAVCGWDPEVVEYLKEASVSILRFPGGNFASGYHWEEGIGPRALRPEKPNPAWPVWESNQVGTDEWLTLCELIGAEPLICVNAGNGTPYEAAEWIHYVNDPENTEWGRRRAQNGHPAPYNVRLWEVGNELWGSFQINWAESVEYGERCGRFAREMREADPTIDLIAVGGSTPSVFAAEGGDKDLLGARYAQHVIRDHGEQVWGLAEHAVMGIGMHDLEARDVYLELIAHTHQIGELITEDRRLLAGEDREIFYTQTEQMVAVRGADRPTDESLAAAIVWSGFMNWFLRNGDFVRLFTRSAMINHGDFLKKERGVTYPLPGYWAQAMYARQPGRIPVPLDLHCQEMASGGDFFRAERFPVLDPVALLSGDGDQLTVIVANRHPEQHLGCMIATGAYDTSRQALLEQLGAASYTTCNTWHDPDRVTPSRRLVDRGDEGFSIELPPHSLSVLHVPLVGEGE